MVGLTAEPIDVTLATTLATPQDGALCTFVGVTRADADVAALIYEAWTEQAERIITTIVQDAVDKWQLSGAIALHRVGRVEVSEPGVLCAAAAPHRDAAFEGCRFLIDSIKSQAPIWKQEVRADGSTRWLGLPS